MTDTALTAGSIAFTGFNGEGSDNLAFVVLQDLPAGTVIRFTDNSWNGTAFTTNESTWEWTATSDVTAGTVVTMDGLTTGATVTTNVGTIDYTATGSRDIGTSNEVVYAYVGTPTTPTTFLAAISQASAGFGTTAGGVLTNTGLTQGTTAVALKSGSNTAAYVGPRLGLTDFSGYLADIGNSANWITENTSSDDSSDGIAPDVPFSLSGFATDPNVQTVNFSAGSLSVSQAEGDSGDTVMTFTVERTGSTDGAVSFTGNLVASGVVNAADFGGTLPTTFSGTIADGATTGTVTIHISGDTTFEANEQFALRLQNVTNTSAPVILGNNANATGTIVNDDPVPAQIAFVGYNDGGSRNTGKSAMAFVALSDIAAGTEIKFASNETTTQGFAIGAAAFTWTAGENIAAGTVITLDGLSTGAATSNHGTIEFTKGTSLTLPTSREVIYAYEGPDSQPTAFLTALASYNFVHTLDGTGLTDGVNAITLKQGTSQPDIAVYNGPRYGLSSYSDYLAALNNTANWIWQASSVADPSNDGISPDLPFPTYPFSIDPTAQIVQFDPASLTVTHAEGAAGNTTTYTFTVNRTNGTAGELDFSAVIKSFQTDANDFGGTIPVVTGVFADGQSSTTVTVTVAGDSIYENDESFQVVLQSGSNPDASSVVIGTNTTATGTITNDDAEPGEIFAGQTVSRNVVLSGTDFVTIDAGGTLAGQVQWNGGNGTIDNSGSLLATSTAVLGGKNVTGSLTITNHQGAISYGDIDTHKADPSAVVTITNAGTISADANDKTIEMANAAAAGQDWILNQATGVITNDAAGSDIIRGGQNTSIDNFGRIAAVADTTSQGGDAIDYQSNSGGVVHNETGGWIEGSRHGITGDYPVTVTNDVGATIIGRNGSAVNIDNGPDLDLTVYITNHGDMEGRSQNYTDSDGDAVDVDGQVHVDNYGTIQGLGANGYHDGTAATDANISEGIAIGGGTINNYAGGMVYGYGRAIEVDDSSNGAAPAATIIYNEGTIQGDGHGPTGVLAADAATMQAKINGAEAIDILGTFADTITNTATGQIKGGIFTDGGDDVLSNAGSITALAGSAVNMGDGNDTVTNTGTITGNVLLGAGDDVFNASVGSTVTGTIDGGDGNDTINLTGTGTGTLGAITNVETVNLKGGDWTVSNEGFTVNFEDGAQTFEISNALLGDGSFAGTINGLGVGDAIDLKGVGTATAATLGANNVLTVQTANGPLTLQLDPSQNFTGWVFQVAADGQGGSKISAVAATQTLSFTTDSISVSHAEGDDGSTTFTFTVTRSGGTVGDLHFTGNFIDGYLVVGGPEDPSADDFGGALPPGTFSGTILDGQTSATITYTVTGDTQVEDYEVFTLKLTGGTNSDGGSVKLGTSKQITATGTIVNDDWTIHSGETVHDALELHGNDHLIIEAGGTLTFDKQTVISWLGTGTNVQIDNAGLINALGVESIGDTTTGEQGTFTLNNANGATINGTMALVSLGTGSVVNINNHGLINGQIAMSNAGSKAAITLNNYADGIITRGDASSDVVQGVTNMVINNYGKIVEPSDTAPDGTPLGTGGDAIDYAGRKGGVVNNYETGLIEGSRHAVTAKVGITVDNDGTMIGRNGSAVNVDNDATVANTVFVTNHGDMEGRSANYDDSDGDAIDVDGLLQLDNYGTVQGLGANGYHDGTEAIDANISEGVAIGAGSIHNYAGATIYGYGRAIQVDDSSNGPAFASTTIINDGLIQGDGHGPTGVADADAAFMQAKINGAEAIDILGTFADTITNTATGVIKGGIFTDGGDDILSNAGSIKALAGSAVNMGDGNDTLTNTGTITGDVLLGTGDDTINISVGSSVTGTINGGDGNDTINLVGTGDGTLGTVANVENLVVQGGNWTVSDLENYDSIDVKGGAALHVYYGNSADNITVEANGYLDVLYSSVSNVDLSGYQQVLVNGIASDTTVENGGYQYVGAGGVADGTVIKTGGFQYVDVGATATNTVVAGGTQAVVGTSTGTSGSDGGTVTFGFGVANGATIASGAAQHVYGGGLATNTTVEAGGYQDISLGGTATNTLVEGYQQVLDTGVTKNTTIDDGGQVVIQDGGVAKNTHLIDGTEYVKAGGVQNGINFSGGAGTLQLDNASSLTGTIANFEAGDQIDLLGTSIASYSFSDSVLKLVTSGGDTISLQFSGLQAGTQFDIESQAWGGTSIALLTQFSASANAAGSGSTFVPQDNTQPQQLLAHA